MVTESRRTEDDGSNPASLHPVLRRTCTNLRESWPRSDWRVHFRPSLKREAACSRVADNPTPRHAGGYQIFLPVSLHRTGKVWGLRQRKAVVVNKTGVAVILLTVIGLHLLTMNVLYPKIVLFWAWIWGDGPNARHTVGGRHQDHLRLHRVAARIGSGLGN